MILAAVLSIILIGLIALIAPMPLAALIIGGVILLPVGAFAVAVVRERARQHTVEMPAGETILPPPTRETRHRYGDH